MMRCDKAEDAGLIAKMIRAMVTEMEAHGGHKTAQDETVWASSPNGLAGQISDSENHCYLVAEIGVKSTIVGFGEANSFVLGGAWEPVKMLHIRSVYVVPGHRRTGVGEQLVRGLMDWGASVGCTACELNVLPNNPAKSLYEKFGFEEFQTQMIVRYSESRASNYR